jgi:hypothetical protein
VIFGFRISDFGFVMMEPSPANSPPAWVHKRDGSLVPFEADKISRALFAASERLGRPDAFLARELTDGVVHFVAAEFESAAPTTAQIAELVVKVVRELGQPALAQAFVAGSRDTERAAKRPAAAELVVPFSPADEPEKLVRTCLRAYSLRTVFARDLAAAHTDGLLLLGGLEAPLELEGCILPPPAAGAGLIEAVEEARQRAGAFLAIDGPEHILAQRAADGPANYVRELTIGLRATGLEAVVNLNCATPPSWADDLASGPLFFEQRRAPKPERLTALADAALEQLLRVRLGPRSLVRVDWHLGERDFAGAAEDRLLRLARRVNEQAPLAFVFDRPRRPVALAEGVDRQHPATLLTVELPLPRLAAQVTGQNDAPAQFLRKLGSLVRLALSAAVQKRDFLRRHSESRPGLARGFLLDRAQLVVAPVGLDQAVSLLLGQPVTPVGPSLDFARQVIQRLRAVLDLDGQACHIDACLDGFWLSAADTRPATGDQGSVPLLDGLSQLQVAAALQDAADLGSAALIVTDGPRPGAEQIADWLRWAWKQTNLTRLRIVRTTRSSQQLTFPD